MDQQRAQLGLVWGRGSIRLGSGKLWRGSGEGGGNLEDAGPEVVEFGLLLQGLEVGQQGGPVLMAAPGQVGGLDLVKGIAGVAGLGCSGQVARLLGAVQQQQAKPLQTQHGGGALGRGYGIEPRQRRLRIATRERSLGGADGRGELRGRWHREGGVEEPSAAF